MYGCGKPGFIRAMLDEGVVPEVRPRSGRGGGASYWWLPPEVLKVRAIRAKRWQEAKSTFTNESKRPRNPEARRLLQRHHRLEQERNRRLSKIATAKGVSVAKLRIDLGIDRA